MLTCVMGAGSTCKNVLETVRDLILPPHCCGCGSGLVSGWWCETCRKDLLPVTPPRCESCSQPFPGKITGPFRCPNCHGRNFHFEAAVAAYQSRGQVRELVHRLKYGGSTWAARPLAELAMVAFEDPRLPSKIDGLVPVPLHPLRERERGYNQAELLATALTRLTGIPTIKALKRLRHTVTQTHFDRRQRMKNLRKAFAVVDAGRISARCILLVDDVLTTGSTLDECARVLGEAGSGPVYALAIGRG